MKPHRASRSIKGKRSTRRKRSRPSQLTIERLAKNTLFAGVDKPTLVRLAAKTSIRKYRAGEIIFDEHTAGRELYLILTGKIRIKKYTKFGVESLLAVLREGDYFGELALLDGLPRSAKAEAVESSTIASCDAGDVRSLLRRSDAFTLNLLQNLALRLRTMDQTFVRELNRNALAATNKMEKLRLLIEASKTVNSSIELDKLLGLILDAATRSINADRGTLYLIDPSTNELWSKLLQGKNMVDIRLPMGKGLAGYVAQTGETVNIADAYRDPRFHPEIDKKSGYTTHTVLCMPMRDKESKIVGVFQFLNKKGGTFTQEDASFIDAFSVHAAIALENARMAQQMIQSEQLTAVGRMASTIIHDIKNPMGTLRMYAQVIKSRLGDDETADMANEMTRQVDRLVSMAQEVLDFSRGFSEPRIETVALTDVIDDALRFLQVDMARRNVRLEQKLGFSGEVSLDVQKMSRAFCNVMSNAADAMPNGGVLTLTTGKTNGDISIEFSDTGVGVPEEVRAKVFEPFFTHGKKHGTGLGLAIVKKIVEDHHGTIDLTSPQSGGTTVRILLPLKPTKHSR